MISATMQDYLKAIYQLAGPEGQVTTTGIAARLDVTPASVTGMAKKLARLQLVEHERYHGVRLTDRGHRLALETIRHHRLIELYLAEALGMPWDRVHAEAERLEHVLSEDVEERMAVALGNPLHDPHGSPIPGADGRFAPAESTISLADCAPGTSAVVAEVDDRDPALLRRLAEHGIRPGAAITIVRAEPGGGPVAVRIGSRLTSLEPAAAGEVRVRQVSS